MASRVLSDLAAKPFIHSLLLLLFLLVGGVAIIEILDRPTRLQWDFRSYHSAGLASRQGLSPYYLRNLSAGAGIQIEFPFVYPPITLPVFQALSYLDYVTAFRLFLLAKVLAAGALIWLSIWLLPRDLSVIPLLPLFLFAFGGAAFIDLASGNLAMFENLFIWLALIAWLRDRPILFSVLLFPAVALKLVPVLFAPLLLLTDSRHKYPAIAVLIGLILLSGAVSAGLFPVWSQDFLSSISNLSKSIGIGARNPSSRAFIEEAVGFLIRSGHLPAYLSSSIIYMAFAGAVIGFTTLVVLKHRHAHRMHVLMILVLTYVVIAPRFKDYAYTLAVLPAYFLVTGPGANLKSWPLLLLLALPPIFPYPFRFHPILSQLFTSYYPWFCVFALWGYGLFVVSHMGTGSRTSRQSPALEAH